MRPGAAACVVAAMSGMPATAATLAAGPGTAFPLPSAAIAAAAAGDTVVIAPGTYYDCASWRTDRLTVQGGGDVVFSDRGCEGKATFVIGGSGTVLRGLGFVHVRVPDGNGAGIRMEGGSLLVEDCAFEDSEAAVIAGDRADAELVLRRVTARHVGAPGNSLAAVTVGTLRSVRIEDSRFADGRGPGGALRSGGAATVAGSSFSYGVGDSPVLEVDGPLQVTDSTFELSGARPATVRALGSEAAVRGSTLVNRTGTRLILLQDWGGGAPVLAGNTVGPGDVEESGAGSMLHRAKDVAHGAVSTVRHLAGRVRRLLP